MINDGDSTSSILRSFILETPVVDEDIGSFASSALHKLRSIKYGFRELYTHDDAWILAQRRRRAKKIKRFPPESNANYAALNRPRRKYPPPPLPLPPSYPISR